MADDMDDRYGRAVVLSMLKDGAANVGAPPRQYAFEIADQLSKVFAQTAVERDKKGGTAKTERDLLRKSGLLNVIIPPELGGWGMDWLDTMNISVRTTPEARAPPPPRRAGWSVVSCPPGPGSPSPIGLFRGNQMGPNSKYY